MINHFRCHLLNRPSGFFANSLFTVYTPVDFQPSCQESWTSAIDRILFGADPDASLADYRFFQFLRIIDGCHFTEHVRRFDGRETYREDRFETFRDSLFVPVLSPVGGLNVTETTADRPDYLRRTFSVRFHGNRDNPATAVTDGGHSKSLQLVPVSEHSVRVDSLGLILTASRPGSWYVDYRMRPRRSIDEIVRDIIDLPVTVIRALFDQVKEIAPEYEQGFRTITDSLSKFCMVLFAQAVANERMKDSWDKAPKRIRSAMTDPPIDAEGVLYYGSHSKELVRMADLRNELQCSAPIRHRRQRVEFAVPELGYLYLAWPSRFGLPARNRIVLDGFLNSSWTIYYVNDREESYVVFRSEYPIRTDTPVNIEIP